MNVFFPAIFLLTTLLALDVIAATVESLPNSTDPINESNHSKKLGNDDDKIKLGKLIFYEDFDTLNYTVWEPIVTMSGCGTREFQMYHKFPENLYVKDGILYIQPTITVDRFGPNILNPGSNLALEGCTDPLYNGCNKTVQEDGTNVINPVISARIRTMKSFYFKYGKVQVRAKMPVGDWIFPAIWLNPKFSTYGPWPMSGEIDLVESRGNSQLYEPTGDHVGSQQIQSSLHFGSNRTSDRWRFAHATKNSRKGFNQDFHTFEMIWTPELMTFSVDDEEHLRVRPDKMGGFWKLGNFSGENIWTKTKNSTNPTMAPFDQPFYLILNVAVGGSGGFFSDAFVNHPNPKPWKTGDSMDDHMDEAMRKFWQKKEDWLTTWKSPESALRVDYIKVWSLDTSTKNGAFGKDSRPSIFFQLKMFLYFFACVLNHVWG